MEYCEFDPHLVRINLYTDRDIVDKIMIIFKDLVMLLNKLSYIHQQVSIKSNIMAGPIKNIVNRWVDIFCVSLVNSFKASANGWEIPAIAILFGPFR